MKKLKFVGDSYEVGSQLGVIYRENGRDLSNVVINRRTLAKQLPIYRKYFPSLITEIEGIAGGGGFDLEKLFYVLLAQDIDFRRQNYSAIEACTIFGVKTNEGLIVGRNYDWVSQARECFKVYEKRVVGRNGYIGVSDMNTYDLRHTSAKHWSFSAEDVINDKGLFVGLTFAYNHRTGYGLGPTNIMRLIAETCETVEQAIKVFRKVPLSMPKNFFIADKNGDMAVVEHTSKKFEVIYPNKQGVLIQTNHYIAPELAKEDTVLGDRSATTSFVRYAEVAQYVNEHFESFDIKNATQLLRRSAYVYANAHRHQTIWSLAMNMNKQRYDIYYDMASGEKNDILTF